MSSLQTLRPPPCGRSWEPTTNTIVYPYHRPRPTHNLTKTFSLMVSLFWWYKKTFWETSKKRNINVTLMYMFSNVYSIANSFDVFFILSEQIPLVKKGLSENKGAENIFF